MKKYKTWNKNDIDFLKEHWGQMSIVKIAKYLNCSIDAIKRKAPKLGLKDQRLYMEEISINQLNKILGNERIRYKAERNQIPFSYRQIVHEKIRVIDMDKFWRWLNKNRHALSLHNTDESSFGYEPDWVEEKRQADKRAFEYERRRPWSAAEDTVLKQMLKMYKYGYREISVKLKRTEGAIKRRMTDLKIKERPLRRDYHNPWSEKEIELVKKLYLKGYKSCIIAEYINRSALAINGILERNNYFKD